MENTTRPGLEEWEVLVRFLPEGWGAKAKELGALRRCRKIPSADALLRLLLIHLADGCSLRETAALGQLGDIATVSDVALMKRLIASGEWLRWLCVGVMHNWIQRRPERVFGFARRVVVVDGSTIKEPGPTGSSWRLHYAINLVDLRCAEAHVTDCRTAESLQHFNVQKGDLFMADRGYGRASDVRHVVERDADIIVRVYDRNIRLAGPNGERFSLLRKLRTLKGTRLGDWDVQVLGEKGWSHPVRICAVKMSKRATEEAQRKVRRKGQKSGYRPSEQALEVAGYITVLTTLPRNEATPAQTLEMYRNRWQIELAFKHMKSILSLGHLHKVSAGSIQAWIHGKLLVAFLVEALIAAGESFFPWGYELPATPQTQPVLVA